MNLEKIKQFIIKNQLWVAWGAVVLLVSVLLIWAILSARAKNQPTSVTLIDSPIQSEDVHVVRIPGSQVNESDFPSELEVYPIVERNYNALIDTFLSKLKVGNLQKSSVQGYIYTWAQGDNYVEYVPNAQTLFFRFAQPVGTSIETRVSDAQSGSEFLSLFVKNYLDREHTYLNVSASQAAGRTRIEANRDVNGYPLYLQETNGYSDYLIVDQNGAVIEGKITLFEYLENEGESIALVHISNLQEAMSDPDYPVEIFQGFSDEASALVDDEDILVDEQGIEHGDVTDASQEFPIATTSDLETAQLVYYFSGADVRQLSPVYRLESEGSVRYKEQTVSVPLVVYVNALDPDRVFVSDQ